MIQVAKRLWVGGERDLQLAMGSDGNPLPNWAAISAAKEPWHRQALNYVTRAAPHDHPEYLVAERERRLILNLIDAADPAYIPKELVDHSLDAIQLWRGAGLSVLVHCNQGKSRSPTIAMLAMHRMHDLTGSADETIKAFRDLYPMYDPAQGMLEYARKAIDG